MRSPKRAKQKSSGGISRRAFAAGVASSAALTIIPRHVLGGRGYIAPSEKITAACIGVGAQGTRVMMDFMKHADIHIVSVCDVNKESSDYVEWATSELRDKQRTLLSNTDWGADWKGATAGREPAKRLVEAYYSSRVPSGEFKGCSAYHDYRELLEKEKDLDGVIVGTPDHTHAMISIAAMKQKKAVYCQKPLTHSIDEARRMAEVAREMKVATQVAVNYQASEATRLLCEWIWAGAIGLSGRRDSIVRRKKSQYRQASIGIYGSALPRNAHTITSICPSSGAAGMTLATVRSVIWAAIASIRSTVF
jgi:hypothetical protein